MCGMICLIAVLVIFGAIMLQAGSMTLALSALMVGGLLLLLSPMMKKGMSKKRIVFCILAGIILIIAPIFIAQSLHTDKKVECSPLQEALMSYGFTEEEANAFESVLMECGIELDRIDQLSVPEIENVDEFSGMESYTGSLSEKVSVLIITDKKAVTSVSVQFYNFFDGTVTENLYLSLSGGLLKTMEEVVIPETEVESDKETLLMIIAEDMARQVAQNPTTVDFKTMYWGFERKDNQYAVQGTFDCANLFGVKEQHTILVFCESNFETQKMKPYKIVLDGVTMVDESN